MRVELICVYLVPMDYIYVSLSVICALSHVVMFHIFMLIGLPNAKYKLLSELRQGRKNWFLIVLHLASHQPLYSRKIVAKLCTFRTAFVINKYYGFRDITFDPAHDQVRQVERCRLKHMTPNIFLLRLATLLCILEVSAKLSISCDDVLSGYPDELWGTT